MKPDDFPTFFQAIHGHPPFPWQERLARLVSTDGRWPDLLDIPTGLGKTAILDIAVFALACRAALDPRQPGLARRTILVVDRRIVVDTAFARAQAIAAAIRDPDAEPLLKEVAAALRSLHGPTADQEDPLRVVQLRGGMYRDNSWATDPAQAMLVCSTVDQVGSRLLFRGYGLSEFAQPIHAGLVGMDCHIVLDEAHLSEPFRQTVVALAEPTTAGSRGLSLMVMTATPGEPEAGQKVFRLLAEERTHPIIHQRLSARKLAALERIRLPDDAPRADTMFAEAAADAAIAHLDREGVHVVGVVVNRVATARAAFAAVCRQLKKRNLSETDCALLLTGRSRPVERDILTERFWDRLKANRTRSQDGNPLVVVATQCIEAGADLDFDALVSESASLDALRQRFGRLDRLGERGESRATILHRDAIPGDLADVDGATEAADEDVKSDPIYGAALVETWKWLNAQAVKSKRDGLGVEFGIDAMATGLGALSAKELAGLLAPKASAPILLPAHLDAWVQTSPAPAPAHQPPVSVFLHGVKPALADVQVVWRSGLGDTAEHWADIVGLLPPVSGEVLALPIAAIKQWLDQRLSKEGLVLRWYGNDHEKTGAIPPDEIRPGDTIVVPTTLGGVDRYGWNPSVTADVLDLAEMAWWRQRRTPAIRLHIPEEIADDALGAQTVLTTWWVGGDLARGTVVITPAEMLDHPDWRNAINGHLADLVIDADGHGNWAWTARPRTSPAAEDWTGDDDASALITPQRRRSGLITLAAHSRGVEAWARRFATACGLDAIMIDTLAFAGWVHDVGKADPRFQAWLVGGDPLKARRLPQPIAKSAHNRSRVAMRRARERSGYPAGARHEVQSLAMLQDNEAVLAGCRQRGLDLDLVLHLVASHHGRCRPLAPVVDDGAALTVCLQHLGPEPVLNLSAPVTHGLERLGSGVAARFWRMVRRYGAHRLAWYEAILRLADQRRSRAEQDATEDDA